MRMDTENIYNEQGKIKKENFSELQKKPRQKK